jgi:hypothetical protein
MKLDIQRNIQLDICCFGCFGFFFSHCLVWFSFCLLFECRPRMWICLNIQHNIHLDIRFVLLPYAWRAELWSWLDIHLAQHPVRPSFCLCFECRAWMLSELYIQHNIQLNSRKQSNSELNVFWMSNLLLISSSTFKNETQKISFLLCWMFRQYRITACHSKNIELDVGWMSSLDIARQKWMPSWMVCWISSQLEI